MGKHSLCRYPQNAPLKSTVEVLRALDELRLTQMNHLHRFRANSSVFRELPPTHSPHWLLNGVSLRAVYKHTVDFQTLGLWLWNHWSLPESAYERQATLAGLVIMLSSRLYRILKSNPGNAHHSAYLYFRPFCPLYNERSLLSFHSCHGLCRPGLKL